MVLLALFQDHLCFEAVGDQPAKPLSGQDELERLFLFFLNSLGFSLWTTPWNNQKSKSARGSWKSMCKMRSKGRSGSLGLNFGGGIGISSFLLASANPLQRLFPWLGCKTRAHRLGSPTKKDPKEAAASVCKHLPHWAARCISCLQISSEVGNWEGEGSKAHSLPLQASTTQQHLQALENGVLSCVWDLTIVT